MCAGFGEQLNHVTCPSLVLLFEQVGQFAQMVLVHKDKGALLVLALVAVVKAKLFFPRRLTSYRAESAA